MNARRKSTIIVFVYIVLFLLTGRVLPHVFEVSVLSFFVAIMLEPVSNFLTKLTGKRFLSVTISLIIFYGFVAIVIGFLIPVIYQQGKYFLNFMENFLKNKEWEKLSYFKISPTSKDVINNIMNTVKPTITNWISGAITKLAAATPSMMATLFFSIIGSVYVSYYLEHFKKISTIYFFPLSSSKPVEIFLKRSYHHMQSYIVGVTIAALFTAIAMGVFLTVTGISSGILLSSWVFITNYIPIVGVLLELIPLAIAALMKGITVFIWFWIVLIAVHSAAFVIFLKAVQNQSKLNPFWMVIAIIAFTQIIGPIGAFVAVPIAILLKDYWDVFIVPYLKAS